MNLYKKFTDYLLENHPLLWHSKTIQLTVVSLIFWLISFILGYNLTSLDILKSESIFNYYFESLYILFHVIFCIIVICIWAIYFYKNNAFKNLYPIQKGYFTKLFFLLFIPFTILVSAYYPFTKGCISKTRSFFDTNELKQDINKLNIGNAFLINNAADYKIENRVYPKPFPVENIKFDKNINDWNDEVSVIKDQQNNYKSFEPRDYQEKFEVDENGKKSIYFKSYQLDIKGKKCDPEKVICKVYSKEELDLPVENEIINFSNVLITNNVIIDRYNFGGDFFKKEFKVNYAPKVYDWVRNQKYSAIQNSIDEFNSICSKYTIDHQINAKHIVRFLKYKKFQNFKTSIVKSYEDRFSNYNKQDEINQIESVLKRKKETINFMANQHVYFYDKASLESIFINFKISEKSVFQEYNLLLFAYISFSLTWLFICFEFTAIKSFLISIPVAGILIILNSLIIIYTNSFGNSQGSYMLSFLTTGLIIIGLAITSVNSSFFGKKITTLLINLLYLISPIYIMLCVLYYNEMTRWKSIVTPCFGLQRENKDTILMNPSLFFLYSLIGILAFFFILRKWRAKAE
jgi:hypothetical protein